MIVWNKDIDSAAYSSIETMMRPGHADYTAYIKYGAFNDYRGGGRFSGRITAGFVMAGAIAKKLLRNIGIEIIAHTVAIGGVKARPWNITEIQGKAGTNPLHCADPKAAEAMLKAIEVARASGDSIGGIVEGLALNVPVGLGEPVFDTLDGELAKSLLAIPAVKGVEFGVGFAAAEMPGTGSNAAIPRIRWVDAGSPPVYASVPLVQGLNVYAVAVTWPRSIHVTAVKFVYLGPPQSPPYLPPAGFLPNGQVTPMPVLRVASPSLDPAASPTIPPWVDPAAGGPRSGEFLIPPSDSLHNPISSVLTSAWQDSPWPWPYGTYQITVTSDSGYRNIILDLLLN